MSQNNVVELKSTPNSDKKRAERWAQPYSNAKIEDLVRLNAAVSDALQQSHQQNVNNGFTMDVLIETLIVAGVITKEQINATANSFKIKQEKFMELIANDELSPEEKNAIADEYAIEFDFTTLSA